MRELVSPPSTSVTAWAATLLKVSSAAVPGGKPRTCHLADPVRCHPTLATSGKHGPRNKKQILGERRSEPPSSPGPEPHPGDAIVDSRRSASLAPKGTTAAGPCRSQGPKGFHEGPPAGWIRGNCDRREHPLPRQVAATSRPGREGRFYLPHHIQASAVTNNIPGELLPVVLIRLDQFLSIMPGHFW